MKSGFLRHFLVFTPVFALITIVMDIMFDQIWPPEFLDVGISALIAGAIYATLMTLWLGQRKDEGE